MRELSLNILDVVGNSTKAGADLVVITVEESTLLHTMQITIEDNGCGMDEALLKSVTDPFTTTRTTRKVGLGVPLFKMAAEQTGGSFEITSTKGKGTKVTTFFHTDHLDFVPLGNIAETLQLLISGSPQVDFVYTYVKNNVEVEISTLAIKEELGDLPITTPEVVVWLGEYLRELLE